MKKRRNTAPGFNALDPDNFNMPKLMINTISVTDGHFVSKKLKDILLACNKLNT